MDFSVQAWKHSADAILSLDLTDEEWETPTDLPGWTARDVLAHLVHLERVLVVGDDQDVAGGGTTVQPDYTEAGVAARRHHPAGELRAELAELVHARARALADLPEDGSQPAPGTPGGVAWSLETLLRNRAFDMWVHEQDIRRAVGRPGNLDSPGAVLTTNMLAAALPIIVARRAKAPAGAAVRVVVTGPVAVDTTIVVGEDGRARPGDAEPTTTITMDTETFTVLGTGRLTLADVTLEIAGDEPLGRTVAQHLNVAP